MTLNQHFYGAGFDSVKHTISFRCCCGAFITLGGSLHFLYLSIFKQVGSFFMINLCLVVIATQFSETKQRENALMREQRARYMSNDSTLASYSEPGSCYEEMLRYISHLYRKLTRRLQRIYSGWHRYVTGCFCCCCFFKSVEYVWECLMMSQ